MVYQKNLNELAATDVQVVSHSFCTILSTQFLEVKIPYRYSRLLGKKRDDNFFQGCQ